MLDVFVIEAFGQLVCEVLRNDGIFRISAIGVQRIGERSSLKG
jgi:hypothetical protein